MPAARRRRRASGSRCACSALRPRGLDPERRPSDLLRMAGRAASRRAGRPRPARPLRPSAAVARVPCAEGCTGSRKCCAWRMRSASRGSPDVVCPGGARRAGCAGDPYAVIHAAPNIPLQAVDARRLARARRRAARTRPRGRGDRRPGAGRTRLSRRRCGATRRGDAASTARCTGRSSPRCSARAHLCRTRHLRHASCRSERMPDCRAVRPDRSAAVGPGAGGLGSIPWGPPARSSAAATSGWCRTRCRACRASNEGCERHLGSFSRCLDELTPPQVFRPRTGLEAVEQALMPRQPPGTVTAAATKAAGEVARALKGRYG